MKKIYNYYQYSDTISCSGLPTEEELGKIKENGFEIVISLSMPSDSVTLENEDKTLSTLGLTYFHIPVDANAPKEEDFEIFVHLLDSFSDKKIYIHCTKNHRLSTFIYLYHAVKRDFLDEKLLYQFCQPRDEWLEFISKILIKYNKGV